MRESCEGVVSHSGTGKGASSDAKDLTEVTISCAQTKGQLGSRYGGGGIVGQRHRHYELRSTVVTPVLNIG